VAPFKKFSAPVTEVMLSAFKEGDIHEQHERALLLHDVVIEACVVVKMDVRNVIATLLSAVLNLAVGTRRIDRQQGGEQQEAKLLALFVDMMNEVIDSRTPDEARTRARRVVDDMVEWHAATRAPLTSKNVPL
jgi:hypothetical protein